MSDLPHRVGGLGAAGGSSRLELEVPDTGLGGAPALVAAGRRLGWLREWDRTLFAMAALWGALYYLHFQFEWTGIYPQALSDVPVQWAAAVIALQAALRAEPKSGIRRAWYTFAVAYGCFGVGNAISFYNQRALGQAVFPSSADLAYALFYVLAFAGTVRLRERVSGRVARLKLRLDSATILLASGVLLWYFLLRPIAIGRGILEATIATAYPAADLALAFAVIDPLAARSGLIRRDTRLFLTFSFFTLFGADVSFALRNLSGEYVLPHWSDCLWTVSFLGVMAAARSSRLPPSSADETAASRLVKGLVALLPYTSITAVAVLLLFVSREHWGEPLGGAIFAALAVTGLVVARQVLASRENMRLLTERAQVLSEAAAAAETANRAKSQFLANMSHEIRTPLNGVLGMTELLIESGLTLTQRRLAELAHSSGGSLLSIVDDVLDFSRIEAGRLELERVTFDVRKTVEGVIELLVKRDGKAKNVDLRARISRDVPDLVRGDPGRLRQILINLVGNAVKFTPQGEILVRVGVLDQAGPSSRLEFEVQDTGIGIAPEALSRIFGAFAQADGSTTRRYGGTGLGLAICKQLVGLMGGDLTVKSVLGVGSTFRFTACFGRLPATVGEAAAGPPALEKPGRPGLLGSAGHGMEEQEAHRAAQRFDGHVLLVEDSAVNLAVAEGMLERLGPQVELASDGSEALAALARTAFDLVLMDCMMPGMDGYAATEELRRREHGSGRRTPVVALTANAMSGDRERCLAAGMDDYLSKPFRHEELRQVLARWLPERQTAPGSEALPERAFRAPTPYESERADPATKPNPTLRPEKMARHRGGLGAEAGLESRGHGRCLP